MCSSGAALFKRGPRVQTLRLAMRRRVMTALALATCTGCASMLPTDAPRPIVRGPIAVKTNAPIAGNFLQLRPRATTTTPVGAAAIAISSSYSSIFENGHAGGNDVVLDGELWRNSVTLRTGVTSRADVEVELSLVYAASGFLDDIVDTWHDFLGLPTGGREERPRGKYEMRIEKDGREAFRLEGNELGLGDVPIVLTQRIVDESASSPGIALRAGVELPIGAESKGFGNGGIDWGGGACVERTFGRCTLSGGAYYVFVATPDSFDEARIESADQLYVHVGLEVRWNDSSSLVLGLRHSGATTRDIEIKEVDGSVLDLDVGWAVDTGERSRLVFGLTEDLIAESGPDFTVFAGLSFDL